MSSDGEPVLVDEESDHVGIFDDEREHDRMPVHEQLPDTSTADKARRTDESADDLSEDSNGDNVFTFGWSSRGEDGRTDG